MNDKLVQLKNTLAQMWSNRSKLQKGLIIGGGTLFITAIILVAVFAGKTKLVPLYKDLSPQETGQIKENLDARGVQSEIRNNGTAIHVPEEMVDTLKVELAAEGLPDSGAIDYSFFGEKSGFGMTDNEFDVIKLKATQTELANLMKGIEGVKDAKVMINMPKESVFVGEQTEGSSASVVLNLEHTSQLDQNKINALYHLVSKSVPNLSTDNIVIMDQNFNYYDLNKGGSSGTVASYSTQHEVKAQIERDLQREVQKMLGTMMGQDKVVVSVTTDIDFTQEQREEKLVTPINEETGEGIAVSVERITETYSGEGAPVGGVPGTAENDVTTYQAAGANGSGDYEKIEERVNNEVNRISKQIVESPYKVRDIGIQVMVEPPTADDPASLPQDRVNDIEQILSTIVRTSIDKTAAEELTDQAIQDKIVVSVQPFGSKEEAQPQETAVIPMWMYIVGGALLLIIIILVILLIRKKRNEEEVEEEEITIGEPIVLDDINEEIETEATVRKKQLEQMAKEKPEDFAKLLRSWISED